MSVRKSLASCAVVLTLFAAPSLAQSAATASMAAAAESRISFDGTSTVRAFTCKAAVVNGNIETNATGAPSAAIQGLVRGGEVSVAVEKLDCANGTMNDHMRKALKATL